MIYVTTDNADNIVEAVNSEHMAVPPGATALSDADADTLAAHPVGAMAFQYINGSLVERQAVMDDHTLARTRQRVIRELEAYGLALIDEAVPGLGNPQAMNLLVELHQAGAFASGFPTPGSDMDRVKDIYLFIKTRSAQAMGATQAQLDAVDIASLPWP